MQSLQVRNTFPEQEIDETPAGVPLQEYWQILQRRRMTILQIFILVAVLGTIFTLLTKPVYQATARLLVDGQSLSINTVDESNPLSGILALSQEQDVATQVEELQAQPLIDQVVRTVGPATMTVASVKDTNVIEVIAEANKPKIAADAANTLLQTYIDQDVNRNLTEIRDAEMFAKQKELEAHQRLLASELQIRQFKNKTRISDITLNRSEQVAFVDQLKQQVQKDNTGLQALGSEINTSDRILKSEPSALSYTLPQTNPMRSLLMGQIATLKLQRVSMTQKGGYTSRAPQIMSIDAQIADLNNQLKSIPLLSNNVTSNINPNRQALSGKLDDLKSQEASQRAQLNSDQAALALAQINAGNYPTWEQTLDDLTREHDAAESDDKMFSDKLAELSLREQAHHAAAHIIESAQVPAVPVRPKKITSIVFSCLMGLFLGVVLALVQEFLDDRINSADEASKFLGVPSLGLIPVIEEGEAHLLPDMKGLASAAESYRIMRTNIHFAAVDSPVKTLLVTSSGPGEGKTTTATNIAFAMALDGKKVTLVDTDLRRPSLHKTLKLPVAPGLTDVLLGHATLADTLQPHDTFPNLSILCSGSTPPNPGELLNSRKFRALVDELKEGVDIVIFDSAPVLVAADSAILASQVDGTLFVVEAGGTKKATSKRAIQILNQARAAILGVAYNKMSSHEGEGYYYYRYNYHTMLPEGQNGVRNGSHAKVISKLAETSENALPTIDGGDSK